MKSVPAVLSPDIMSRYDRITPLSSYNASSFGLQAGNPRATRSASAFLRLGFSYFASTVPSAAKLHALIVLASYFKVARISSADFASLNTTAAVLCVLRLSASPLISFNMIARVATMSCVTKIAVNTKSATALAIETIRRIFWPMPSFWM